MLLLPKGNPIKEKVNPARVNLPEAMEKLAKSGFSGYMRFVSPAGTGVIIFQSGRLISALMQGGADQERIIAYDAIMRIFEISILGNAMLDVYRFSPEVAISIHALLHGEYVYRGQDIKLINIKGLLNQIRKDRLSGCLRVYTDERVALIFYDQGNALGFFHDGSTRLETTADVSLSVANLPGAKLDLLSTETAEGQQMADLMTSADLSPMWAKVRTRLLEERKRREPSKRKLSDAELEARRTRIFELLRGIAERHIGQFGANQVEKAFDKVSVSLSIDDLDRFFAEMTKMAKLVAGPSKVKEMIEKMRQGIQPLL